MVKLTLSCILFLFLTLKLSTQPIIQTVDFMTSNPVVNEKVELRVEVSTSQNWNFFDYDQIVLKAVFRSPDFSEQTIDAFYYQDFTVEENGELIPLNEPHYRVRFSPDMSGVWEIKLILTDQTGEDQTEWQAFFVENSNVSGFLQLSSNQKQLVDHNGQLVFLSGENITWTSNYPGYDPMAHYFEQLSENGGNFAKLMLTPWGYHIEWIEGGLRNYMPRQIDAFMLDSLFNMAHNLELYLQLAFSIHNELNFGFPAEDWTSNPYNIANGGFCQQPYEFFTHPEAKAAFKNRMRYIVARYGYSRQLMAWEVFSETDNFPFYSDFRNQISNWIIEMAGWLQENDPFDHLVSVGFALPESEPQVWQHPSIDFTQLHLYYKKADLAGDVLRQMNMYLKNFQKPVLVGEFGIGHFSDSMAIWDPQGLALHNALYSSSMAGSMGAVVPWYWEEYIDQLNLYNLFGAVHGFAASDQLPASESESLHLITDAELRTDWEISPAYFSLTEAAPSRLFEWHTTGQMIPSADSLNRYLYGPLSLFASLRNPPEISGRFLHEGHIRIETGAQVNQALLQVKQNGIVIFEQEVFPNESYWIEVQPGQYNFIIDNIGLGFASVLEIDKIILENYLPQIRAFGLKSPGRLNVWIQNRDYNWKTFYDQQPIPQPASAEVFLPLPTGNYRLDWINTETGNVDSVRIREAFNEGMTLQVESLEHDLALQLYLITSIKPNDRYRGVIVYPNPVRQRVTFAFELAKPSKVVLQIMDIHGRTIYLTEKTDTYKGTNQLHWFFGSHALINSELKTGIYLYRIMFPDRTVTGKLLLAE